MTPDEVDDGIAAVRDWLDDYPEGTVIALFEARAWEVKGYPDWDALCAAEFPMKVQLPRPERRELVASLAGAGMSTRAIASAVGVGQRTVVRDLGESDDSPEAVTGLDGKTYIRQPRTEDDAPRPPRPPFIDPEVIAARQAEWNAAETRRKFNVDLALAIGFLAPLAEYPLRRAEVARELDPTATPPALAWTDDDCVRAIASLDLIRSTLKEKQ